ncbi:MAG: hypothetical protein HKP25_11275 [Marinicaulis sp.]|nr:hypothetical protein [Marinicaulis sp.]
MSDGSAYTLGLGNSQAQQKWQKYFSQWAAMRNVIPAQFQHVKAIFFKMSAQIASLGIFGADGRRTILIASSGIIFLVQSFSSVIRISSAGLENGFPSSPAVYLIREMARFCADNRFIANRPHTMA